MDDAATTTGVAAATTTGVAAAASDLEQVKRRCLSLQDEALRFLPPSKVSPAAKLTLLRLLDSEFRFLSRPHPSLPLSSNLNHLESLARIVLHPSTRSISRISKPIPGLHVHVDVVCTVGNSPAWFVISARNPRSISWLGSGKDKGVKARVERVLAAARSGSAVKPAKIFLVFAGGVGDEVSRRLIDEFGAVESDFGVFEELEEGWVRVGVGLAGRVFEIRIGVEDEEEKVVDDVRAVDGNGVDLGAFCDDYEFGYLVAGMNPNGKESVNFDTTALVALVSGISNGGTQRLLRESEGELRARFKSNYEFVLAQVTSELEHPILIELRGITAGKKGIICESVSSELKELIAMCGGPNEKLRADHLLRHLLIVPDRPSARVAGLPTTRKIALKNKIVFGTGDHWQAPTLTANMGFVRAITQTGMSLLTIEHRPRALTGD